MYVSNMFQFRVSIEFSHPETSKGGTIWHFFNKTVHILLAGDIVSILKKEKKENFSRFRIHSALYVFVKIKSLVQAKIYLLFM